MASELILRSYGLAIIILYSRSSEAPVDRRKRNRFQVTMLPGARQPARVGMEHTALKLTDPAVLRMVAAGWQGE